MKKKKVAVFIPVHSEHPTEREQISLKQCLTVLAKHPIYIVAPRGLNIHVYKKISDQFILKYVDPIWLSSIQQYNLLKRSTYFYDLFKEFDYILTYELDAFVFTDDLIKWCKLKYDYIGAPWLEGWGKPVVPHTFIGVGNSGFSLRKVSSCRCLLRKLKYLEVLEKYKEFNWKGVILNLPLIINGFNRISSVSGSYEKYYNYMGVNSEDIFWCYSAPHLLNNFNCKSILLKMLQFIFLRQRFKVAPIEVARKFSFETNPRLLYKMNKEKLPFGCHAWYKYDATFWKPFIFKVPK